MVAEIATLAKIPAFTLIEVTINKQANKPGANEPGGEPAKGRKSQTPFCDLIAGDWHSSSNG